MEGLFGMIKSKLKTKTMPREGAKGSYPDAMAEVP